MNKISRYLPDKLFGQDVGVLMVWLPPITTIFVLSLILLNIIFSRVDKIKDVFSQTREVAEQTKILNDKIAYLANLDTAELDSKLTTVNRSVLSEKNSYLLIKIISKIVSNFGFSIGDFSVTLGDIKEIDKKVAKAEYQRVPVNVVVTGPRANFLAMVEGIEKSLPVLSIDSFTMTGSEEVVSIKMGVSGYYLPNWGQSKLENISMADLTPNKVEAETIVKMGDFKFYGGTDGELNRTNGKFTQFERADPFY